MSDSILDLEFTYTPYEKSCKDLYSVELCCQRPANHTGNHAGGRGRSRVQWAQELPDEAN